ncbi:MAG: DNA polymerase IV [Thaumarchaeota archaeon]|nr:DNA polymerase IV [Nitrososphaerota archaeon]
MERIIGHLDLDYFYAQVEEVENPSLKERPVIVCVFSGRTEDSGVVSTANYRARELGAHSGMPIALAKKKLDGKNAAVIKMDHEKYEVVSNRIMEDIAQKVDTLEPTGIDEAFFDLTTSTGGDYAKAGKTAEAIKESILNNEHLTCSVGLGRSKVVAKLGSDTAKPGGLKVVKPETTMAFLNPLLVTKLYGVGPKTASTLEEMRVKTVGDLARIDLSKLDQRFGRKFGAYLLAAAKGEDDDPVRAGLEPTQFSRIVTLKRDTRDPGEAFDQLVAGIEYVHGKLVSSGKSFRTVTAIGILSDLSTKTKSKTFETPINDAARLRESARSLFDELSGVVDKDFRRVGLRVSGFTGIEDQTSLSEFLHPVG